MGVHGLWQLLDPLGRPVSLESLQSKILAVDASIWLHQSVRGLRDKHGNPLPNAHLLGLFNRICKLLFYGIRPVFVFDGKVPFLKRQTMAKRRERQQAAAKEIEKNRREILSKYLQSKAIRDSLGDMKTGKDDQKPLLGLTAINSGQNKTDIYDLPPIPSTTTDDNESEVPNDSEDSDEFITDVRTSLYQNLDAVDIDSDDFKALPVEIQHEILVELKDRLRHRSWTKGGCLPDNDEEIGNFQIRQLLDRRKIQCRLDTIKKGLSNVTATRSLSDSDQDIESQYFGESRRIASEDYTHYILLKLKDQSKSKSAPPTSNVKQTPSEKPSQKKTETSTSSSSEFKTSSTENEKPKLIKNPVDERENLLDGYSGLQVEMRDEVQVCNDICQDDARHQSTTLKSNNVSETKLSNDRFVDHLEKSLQKSTSVDTKLNPAMMTVESNSLSEPRLLSKNVVEDLDNHLSNVDYTPILPSSKAPLEDDGISEDKTKAILDDKSDDVHNFTKIVDASENRSKTPVSEIARPLSAHDVPDSEDEVDHQSISSDEDSDFVEVPSEAEQEADELFPLETFLRPPEVNERQETVMGIGEESEIESPTPLSSLFLQSSPPIDREELRLISEELERQTEVLLDDKNRQERIAATMSDQMYLESQELLKLFGIPYITSPGEAEAQCAVLDMIDLIDGTITDDSDIWLFGAKRVYKNFFELKREVLFFNEADIQRRLSLDRAKLIAVALLTGSDYTEGIKNVGVVTALEILGEFKEDDSFTSLKKFREWWDATREQTVSPLASETKIKQQLRRLTLNEGFPSKTVLNAYLNPSVDSSTEKFSWGFPDLDALRQFACSKLGWSLDKVNDVLLPVMKKVTSTRERQTCINNYFIPVVRVEQEVKQPSRRLKRALRKFGSQGSGDSSSTHQQETCPKLQSSTTTQPVRTVKRRQCNQRKQVTKNKLSISNTVGDVDLSESSESAEELQDDEKYVQLQRNRKAKSARKN